MAGMLYLCATPIGNLEDITFRVLRTLKEVDLIAAEDTRNSQKLLNHFDIHTPMTSYHEYNKYDKAEYLVGLMLDGKNIACITDAGTPGISGQQPLQQGSLLCGPSAYDTRQRFRRVCVPRKRYVKGEHQSVCGKAWAGQLPAASGCRDELVRCKGGD